MSKLVERGFEARKSGDEDLELHYFGIWREEMRIPSDSLKAELLWEMQLSKLKMQYLSNMEMSEDSDKYYYFN